MPDDPTHDLWPCPFCGGNWLGWWDEANTIERDSPRDPVWIVSCHRCGADGPGKPTREAAVAAWNRRAGEEKLETEPDRLISWRDRLVFDANVSDPSPVVKGTWVTADSIVSLVVNGCSWDNILRNRPELTADDIRACLAWAAENEEKRATAGG